MSSIPPHTNGSASPHNLHGKLPPLVGLGSFEQAFKAGLPVEECVRRLKRFHYCFWRLHQIYMAHIATEPLYELKMAFSYHSYLAAESDTGFRTRVGEMREPPLGLEKVPHPALAVFFDEILATPSTEERLLGIYEKALPLLRDALNRYIAETHVLSDAPSIRLARHTLLDLEEMLRYGQQVVKALVTEKHRADAAQWLTLLDVCLAVSGGIEGADGKTEPNRYYSSKPFAYDGTPIRDARFPDPYNMGVNAEAMLYDENAPDNAKVLMMFYKRLREVDVPEMMSSIIFETRGKPWAYYRDMTRQLWDEARHAMMGEVGFESLAIDWGKLVMVNSTWSRGLNLQLTPKERHAVLYFIEQGLMPRTGKRHEWEVSKKAHDLLSTTFQDFDWADEVLHSQIGRQWYVADMPTPAEAIDYGDKCWSKVMADWRAWRDAGLTQHRNWWPELYLAYCQSKGIQPDPEVLAFNQTYENKRADHAEIVVST